MTPQFDLKKLENLSLEVRRDIIKQTGIAASGHPGGSLSVTDVLVSLYFQTLRHDPKNPKWADRDRVIFSKGHGSPALYSVMALAGYFDREAILTFRQLESPFQGHPDMRRLPGIEMSTGSLGQGLSVGAGCALAARMDKKDYRTYVIMSDGELNEGQTWEAAAFAAFRQMSNLVLVLDMNQFQLTCSTKDTLCMDPVGKKWEAFGWAVKEIDGHSHQALHDAFEWAKAPKKQPSVILCDTVKGKGVSFMEHNNHFHGVAPTKDETARALKELGENDAEIQRILGKIK